MESMQYDKEIVIGILEKILIEPTFNNTHFLWTAQYYG